MDRAPARRARAPVGGDEIPRAAWRDHGAAVVVGSPEDAVRAVDGLAPEHLEVQTDRDDWYFEQLRNYGSVFLGPRATVAFSDKAIGTNHTLPTGQAARYTGGLSVAKFLKTLTFQRIDTDAGVAAIAPAVAEISRADLMPAHEATANLRMDRWAPDKRLFTAVLSRAFPLTDRTTERALAQEDEGHRGRGSGRHGDGCPLPGDLAGHRLGV